MANQTKTYYANNRKYILNSKKLTDPPIPMDLSREITKMFDLNSRKTERISEYMCKNIRQTKLRALRRRPKTDVIPSVTRPLTSKDFREFSEKCPTTDMSRLQEKIIRNKIQSRGLEKLFPQLVEDIMRDTKLEYKKITHYAGVNLRVKDKYPEEGFVVQGYRFMGRTDHYPQFLCLKKQFEIRWILHYGIMRKLLAECVIGLPYELVTLDIRKVLELEELRYIFKEKVQYTAAFLHEFYKKVCAILNKAEDIIKKRQSKLLPACTGLFSVHVSRNIAHTMQSIVRFTESTDVPPYLKLYVDFEAVLVLTPTAEEVIQHFCQFLDDLINAGEDLYVLEKGRIKGFETKTIYLCLTKEFIDKCKWDIAKNITRLYEPILRYLDKLSADFKEIYSDINSEEFFQSISDILFEDGCEKIQYYKKYIHKVAYIPDNEYFKIGQLVLTNYREKLHESLVMITDSIFKNLSLQHLWEVNDICDSFVLIKVRATQKPITTEELIEIGKFMSWAKDEQLEDLNQRVHDSLASLCNIITLGPLDEDHMALNSAAINWLDDILPIVEQHTINYEQLKFEAEEKLQKVIEDINVLIVAVYPLLVVLDEMDNIKFARKYLSDIALHMTKIKEIQQQIEWINNEEACLSFPKSSYAEFENLKDYVYPFYHLLKLCLDIQKHVSVWQYGQFDLLDYESTNIRVERFCKELAELQKSYKKKLRQAQDENLPIRFKGTVDDPDLLNWPAPLKLCATASKILEEFKPSLTIMKIMCNDDLRTRHWKAMSEIAGFNLTPNAGTTLKKVMEIDFKNRINEYEIISVGATKEQQLLDHLNQLKLEWETSKFVIEEFMENILVLTHLEDIQVIVDDHIIKVLNMRGSVFVKPYEEDVLNFYDTILKVSSVLTNWKIIQQEYLKLSPIFAINDVAERIPKEKFYFQECDSVLKKYIETILEEPVVIKIVSRTSIVIDLEVCLGKLEQVQKGISNYLENVRFTCPRLYHISNEELVDVIAKNGDLSTQTFLIKIFPGINRVKLENNNKITAIISFHGEEVTLRNPIDIKLSVTLDRILLALENEMLNTVKYKSAECYKIFKKTNLKDLLSRFPQQSLQLMAQVFWTDQVENSLKLSHNIKILLYKRRLEDRIEEKIRIIKENEMSNLQRTVVKNVLLVDLNNKYLLGSFLKRGVVISDQHFDWQVQFRFYFEKSLCSVKILQNGLSYGYEYLGNDNQMIMTPTTDKCFRTLINAYFFNFFGLLRGRTGTGKSITLKGLAQALGILFFSFSCSEDFSLEILLQSLKSSVLCGSWLALENFNHLAADVFSVISQEFLNIIEAKKQKATTVLLRGVEFSLRPSCFICGVTDLETRTSLPENLKVMLRTFTLCKPDLETLAETSFISLGVQSSKLLAKKLKTCFDLMEDVLSFQKQYSFGVRGFISVWKVFEKRISLKTRGNENTLLYISVKNCYENCIVEADQQVFQEILAGIFQETDYEDVEDHMRIKEIVIQLGNKLNLHIENNFIMKVIDTYHILKNSRSTIIVGNSYTAKTTILKICSLVFEELENTKVLNYFINPKCLGSRDLMGYISKIKNEWKDGVILNILRELVEDKASQKWIIFDGHIDGSWSEIFSSILGDRKMFLESQEIYLVPDNVTFIFEATDLKDCSPSMISRCGIVYFAPATLGWMSIVETWLKTCESLWLLEHKNQTEALLKWFIPPCLEALKNLSLNKYCELDDNSLVKNTLTYLQLILDDATSKINKKDEDPKNMSSWIHATFLQAGIFGFSSFLDNSSRQKFDEYYKVLWRGLNKNYPYPNCIERLEVGIPQDAMLFEYSYLYKQRGAWKLWSDLLKNEGIIESQYLSNYIIPTVDTMRCNFLLDLHIRNKQKFLIVGPRSTGKSSVMRDCFINRLKENRFDKAIITFSNSLTCETLQGRVLSKLNKRKGGFYSPSSGKQFVLFIDDLQLSHHDSFGVSNATELLRQHVDHNTWYNLENSEKIHLTNVNLVASMGLVKDFPVKKRFLRHFTVFGITEFSCDTITKIYSQSLLHSWRKSGFPSDILTAVNQIVSATLCIFELVQKNLKPSLSKCQYVFDLVTVSKVMRGCSLLKKESYDANKKVYLKLWVHEMIRVFADRFDFGDIRWLSNHLKHCIGEYFSEDFEEVFGNTDQTYPFSKLFFGTFNEKHTGIGNKYYDEVSFNHLADLCHQCLREYNEKSRFKLDLIFFDYALEKLARICRILSMPNENAVLLGLTGCGRKSLTKFASFIHKNEIYEPMITRTYDLFSWNQDFKNVFKRAGAMDKECTFIITEEDLIDANFLEIIDYFIRDGEITDLYTLDEKQEILELSRLAAQGGNRNLDISSHRVFLYFNKRCRENLHLFLCLNSGSNSLRKIIRKYPSLVNRFHVILWKDWPDNGLQCVAETWIKDVNIPADIKSKTVGAAIFFHRTGQSLPQLKNFVTSKAYIHLIKLFSDLIVKKQDKLTTKKKRFQQGLAKLSYAALQISNMQKALAEYQPQLAAMTQNAIEMTKEIALETIQVEKASALVRKDEKIAGEQAAVAQVLKSECESELAQAIPILEDAISALNTLKPSDITLVKSMKNPPDAIKLVMASVCVIKDVKPDRIPDPSTGRKTIDYWGPSKRILGDMNFLQTLKDFDKDRIKPEIMVKIRKEYLPHKDFQPHVVAKASSAAEGLCKWIIAMDMYDRVAKEVAPKKEKLNKAEKEYAETMRILNEKKEEVMRIEEKLAQLNVLLDEAKKKQNKLQIEVDICNKKLASAQKLIGSLSGEKLRWTEAVENLQRHYDLLAGDIMLSSAVIAYLAPLDKEVRLGIMQKWLEYVVENDIPSTKDFDFSQVLSNDVEIDHWKEYGLPLDSFYIENAVIYKKSKNFCLFLDPQGQAANWILKSEGESNVIVTKFSFQDWLSSLQYCISHGKTILIKDTVGYIPPCLNYFLYRQTVIQDEKAFVTLNEKEVRMSEKFRLYIVCSNPKASYPLELKSRLTIINFALINTALRENLLRIVVEIERPEIKKLTQQLVTRTRENKADLKDLEVKILDTLCESEADILEDEESIVVLDKSKELARIVIEKQEETKKINIVIEDFKKGYVNVAQYVTDLFFCINDLQKLHPFYQFSLEWFQNLYFSSIINAGKSRDLGIRCQKLCDTFTFDLYKNITKGLFEKDKLMFTFCLASSVALSKGLITIDELLVFLGTKNFFETNNEYRKPSWLCEEIWFNIQQTESLETFKDLVKSFVENENAWKEYFESISCGLPEPWNRINNFGKLILLKILRPEKLYFGIIDFIELTLGKKFLAPMFLSMQEMYNESYSLAPILFILTPGTDVLKSLHNFAGIKKCLHKFRHLSLGVGNYKDADKLIEEGQKEGCWVLLQNCQLQKQWLNQLEQKLESFGFENTHENFRLFLTTEPENNFPLELIQNSIKIIDEPPNILRKNLLKVYNKIPIVNDDFYYGCPGKQDTFSKILYSVCHFHFVLQERQKFFNWNVPYRFEECDLMMSLEQLRNIVNEETCLFEKIYFLIGQCNYNGYLENDWEKQFVIEIMKGCVDKHIFQKGIPVFNGAEQYGLPNKKDRQDYLKHIFNLPSQDQPKVLYLSEYESLRHKVIKTKAFLNSGLKMVQTEDNYMLSIDEFRILSRIDDLLKVVPKEIVRKDVEKYSVYIAREIQLYNNLIFVIRSSLEYLRSALGGNEELTEHFEDLAKCLAQNSLPVMWQKYSYPTLSNLSNFIHNLCEKVNFFECTDFAKRRFWLGAFFFPRALITSVKIEFSRKIKASIDSIDLDYEVSSSFDVSNVGNGIVLDKLILLGAKFDTAKNKVTELSPKSYFDSMAPLLIIPVIVSDENQPKNSDLLKCCIFKTEAPPDNVKSELSLPGCHNFVAEVLLPCEDDSGVWNRRGVSIVCEIYTE